MIRLGSRAKDKISGFEGIVTGRTEWLTGCDRYLLEGPHKDGKRVTEGFDEYSLVVLEAPEVTGIHKFGEAPEPLPSGAKPGGPQPEVSAR